MTIQEIENYPEYVWMGYYVLFSSHINQYTKREHRPTAELLNSILQGCL